MDIEPSENHRTRVGAQRREKARAKLLESALLVFSKKGPEAAVIDEVIALAGMSRGSFYNYFKTNDELLAAAVEAITDELLCLIDPLVRTHEDPVARVACGTRLLLHTVRQYPLLGAFLSRLHWPAADSHLVGLAFLARDIELAIARTKFSCPHRVALDLVVGAMFGAASSLARETLADDYPELIVGALLRGLGVTQREAAKLVALPLAPITLDDSFILHRTLERGPAL